jgi:hypothetical protein
MLSDTAQSVVKEDDPIVEEVNTNAPTGTAVDDTSSITSFS